MKKIYLLLVMVFLGFGVRAQDNGFGVRAGVNIASMTNYNSKAGFHGKPFSPLWYCGCR